MIAITILLIISTMLVFYYTGKSSVKHNDRIIEWMKGKNDKSGRYML